jgi:aspartate aminotransferase
LGAEFAAASADRAETVQTPGGTGGLRVAADFVKRVSAGTPTIWVPDETWANHASVFGAAGLDVKKYPYFDAKTMTFRFEAMIEAIGRIPRGDVILLHGCCHNPTGQDPDPKQWLAIADAVRAQGLIPLLDFAYQGFAEGLEEDAQGVRLFAREGGEALIASSFSKNFSLYNERVGALTVVGANADQTQRALSHVKMAVRTNYSNPPRHGAALVSAVLADAALRAQWEGEVAAMRARIRQMRTLLVEQLKAKGVTRDFSFIAHQRGMFSYLGVAPEQVDALRDKHAIYAVRSGRINVAGITPANIDRLTAALAEVLKG